jgi:hypothetical protein
MGVASKGGIEHLETLMLQSIEGFVTSEEIATLDALLLEAYPALSEYEVQNRATSIHVVAGLSAREAAAVYEPHGRIEVAVLPEEITALLDQALERNAVSIRRQFPSVTHRDAWTYVEYGEQQHVAPHLDFAKDEAAPGTIKVCGISILLQPAARGGEFCIHSCGSPLLWSERDGESVIAPDMSPKDAGFRSLPKTCWRADQQAGAAILYGSQVIHSTTPVVTGRARKIIGFLHCSDLSNGSLHRLSAGARLS